MRPRALLAFCLDAERALKRERRERWGPRIVDIDILAFGDRLSASRVGGPASAHFERAFVLVPLAKSGPT